MRKTRIIRYDDEPILSCDVRVSPEDPEVDRVERTPQLQRNIRGLLREYSDLFSTRLRSEPAKLDAREIGASRQGW